MQGVIAEVREDNVIRSVREDSDSSCVGEIAFFMGIAQPRTFQVCSLCFILLSWTENMCKCGLPCRVQAPTTHFLVRQPALLLTCFIVKYLAAMEL